MIKTKVTSNISFTKLLNNLPKILDKTLNNAAKDSANLSKSNIDNEMGNNVPFMPLSEHSLRYRKQGKFRTGEVKIQRRGRVKAVSFPKLEDRAPTTSKKPLKYTKNLYKSIKANKNSLSLAGYGELHHEGYKTNAYSVPARPFIETTVSKKTEEDFIKNIGKGLMK